MFRALAKWSMDKPLNAIIAIAGSLFIPLLFWLGAALMALSILRHGAKEAANVVLWGSLPAFAWLAMGDPTPLLTALGASTLAIILRSSVDLRLTLMSASGIGVLFYFVLPMLMPEVLAEVQKHSEALLSEALKDNLELWQNIQPKVGPLMVGALAAIITVVMVLCLLLARWWQAAFYNPGGYSKEFHPLRLPVGFTGAVVLLLVFSSSLPPLISGILPVLTIPLVIAGTAFVHGIIGKKNLGGQWLFAFYISVFFFGPYLFTLLIFIALIDSIVDIRGRLKDTVE
jgi:hypothetical protein